MGLDITAYSHLRHIGKHTKDAALNGDEPGGLDDYCHYETHVNAYAFSCFPRSFRGIPVLGTERSSGGDHTFVLAGCFEVTAATETHRFRAGSYGGYNAWRCDLARQFNPSAGPETGAELPFYELIWFADNEGCISSEAAAALLADFETHADQYRPEGYEDYFRQKYEDWTNACRLASDSGLIEFH